MANDYFEHVGSANRISDGTRARGAQVNTIADAVEVGFEKLPTEAKVNRGTHNYAGTSGGSSNAYTATLTHVSGSYADGQQCLFIANHTSTSSVTLNVSGIGAAEVVYNSGDSLAAGAIVTDSLISVRYNATLTKWQLMGSFNITNTVTAFMATLLDDTTAAAALATLGLTATAAEINQIDGVTVGGTSSGDIVTIDDTQTLTNKTIQGGTLTSSSVKATTSGTTIDFNDVPSWAKKITIMFEGVSANSSTDFYIQLGDATSFESTGYVMVAGKLTGTNNCAIGYGTSPGFHIGNILYTEGGLYGAVTLSLIDESTYTWVASGVVSSYDPLNVNVTTLTSSGSKSTTGALTRLRLYNTGAVTFDAGKMNVLYEG